MRKANFTPRTEPVSFSHDALTSARIGHISEFHSLARMALAIAARSLVVSAYMLLVTLAFSARVNVASRAPCEAPRRVDARRKPERCSDPGMEMRQCRTTSRASGWYKGKMYGCKWVGMCGCAMAAVRPAERQRD